MNVATWSYVTGGTLAPNAPSYVERRADKDLLAALEAGETCYVLNSRQMGKSSLCVRTIVKLKAAGVRTAFCDLTKFGGRNLTAEQWYAALLSEIGRDLRLKNEFLSYWKEKSELPPVQRLFGAISEFASGPGPVVIFVDEIDVTLSLPFSSDEFFAAIRQCYVGRATDEKLKDLSFCLLGTATPADLIQDTRVSPFNIGSRIELKDFTEEEARPLAAGLGRGELLNRVLYWTGGHPYLTQRLCQAVQSGGANSDAEVDRICSDLFLTHRAKESDDNLAFVRNRLLRSEADLAALLDLYKKMRSGQAVPDDETNPLCGVLKLSGVCKLEAGLLKVRNPIYEHVFDHIWVETHMPDAEKRRQREAYRRGVFRTLSYSAAAVLVIGGLAVFGFLSATEAKLEAKRAKTAEHRAIATSTENERNLYFANINNLQLFGQEGNLAQMAQVLEETKNSPYRGFEWGYWNGVLHEADEEYVIDSPKRSKTPIGMFSLDGRQLLIWDTVLETAFVIDRASKREIGQYHVDRDQSIFPSRSGWLTYDMKSKVTVRRLETGNALYSLDLSGSNPMKNIMPFAEAGFLQTTEPLLGKFNELKTRLWDVATGKRIWEFYAPQTYMFPLGITRDGNRILAEKYSMKEAVIQKAHFVVFDRATGHEIDNLDGNFATNCTLSESGKLCVVRKGNRAQIRSVDQHRTIMLIDNTASALIDPTDSLVYCTDVNGTTRARSIPQGDVVATYLTGDQFSQCDATGDIMITGTSIKVNRVSSKAMTRSLPTGSVLRDYLGNFVVSDLGDNRSSLSDPKLAPLGTQRTKYPAMLSNNGRITVLNGTITETRSGRKLLHVPKQTYADVAAAKDILLTQSEDQRTIECWKFNAKKPDWKAYFPEVTTTIQTSISWDASLVLVTLPHSIEVLDGPSGRVLKTLESRTNQFLWGSFVGKTNDFYVIDQGFIDIYDGRSYRKRLSLTVPANNVYYADFSPDGRRMVIGHGSEVEMYDCEASKRVLAINAGSWVTSALFTSDGKKIVAGQYGKPVVVLKSDETDRAIHIHVNPANPLAYTPDPPVKNP